MLHLPHSLRTCSNRRSSLCHDICALCLPRCLSSQVRPDQCGLSCSGWSLTCRTWRPFTHPLDEEFPDLSNQTQPNFPECLRNASLSSTFVPMSAMLSHVGIFLSLIGFALMNRNVAQVDVSHLAEPLPADESYGSVRARLPLHHGVADSFVLRQSFPFP